MSFPNLSALAVRERAVTLFFLILSALAGLYAFLGLGRAEDPAFTVRILMVSALWPGATAQQMEDQVAHRLPQSGKPFTRHRCLGRGVVRSQGRKGIDHCAGTKQILDGVSLTLAGCRRDRDHGDAGANSAVHLFRERRLRNSLCVAQRSEEYGASLGYSVSGNLLGDLGRCVQYIHHHRDRSGREPT